MLTAGEENNGRRTTIPRENGEMARNIRPCFSKSVAENSARGRERGSTRSSSTNGGSQGGNYIGEQLQVGTSSSGAIAAFSIPGIPSWETSRNVFERDAKGVGQRHFYYCSTFQLVTNTVEKFIYRNAISSSIGLHGGNNSRICFLLCDEIACVKLKGNKTKKRMKEKPYLKLKYHKLIT